MMSEGMWREVHRDLYTMYSSRELAERILDLMTGAEVAEYHEEMHARETYDKE